MKMLKSNVVRLLQGKSDHSELYLDEETQRVTPKYAPSSTLSFVLKISILLLMVVLVGLGSSFAQTKRVWGDMNKAKFQPFGESYVGFMTGTGLTPTGVSALMYINPNSAIHAYSALKGNMSTFTPNNEALFGLAYQPQLTFRTGELNCGYYISIGGEINNSRDEIISNPHSSLTAMKNTKTSSQYRRVTASSVNLGVGVFFEVNGKWQAFAERIGRFNSTTLSYGESMYYTSMGVRFFILNGVKR